MATFFAPDQHEVTHEIQINRNIEACWDATFNPATVVAWRDNLDSVEIIDGVYDASNFKARFVFHDDQQVSKPMYTLDSVVKHVQAKSSIILNDKISLHTKYEFAAIDSASTQMRVITTLIPNGWLYKVMFSGSGNGLEEKRKAELDNLKKWLENQAIPQA